MNNIYYIIILFIFCIILFPNYIIYNYARGYDIKLITNEFYYILLTIILIIIINYSFN